MHEKKVEKTCYSALVLTSGLIYELCNIYWMSVDNNAAYLLIVATVNHQLHIVIMQDQH